MDRSNGGRWLLAVVLFAGVYAFVGIAFAAFAKASSSNEAQFAWRLAAWLASAVAFAAHFGYEDFRLRHAPRRTAINVSLAVALGALALAVWINVHRPPAPIPARRSRALLALVVFPVVTGAPAFLVALAASAVLARRGLHGARGHRAA
jgi:hypothetical protein